ncbi:MAG: hypothetical protein KatS3mg068_2286 [Candidatus Sericytochromatia bacterium]|nr:MAG: hypothetical protein KatS3mg068_2286 [Candidatus Sericytochromatia bacterium]
MKKILSLCLSFLASVSIAIPSFSNENQLASKNSDPVVRVKDVAQIRNARANQISGLGIVIGLQGTGDSQQTIVINRAYANMLERLGLPNMNNAKFKNIAAVIVTANLPPFVKQGQTIDVNVASIGDAKSIENGVLVRTPLLGPDGRVYAVAQGPISIGGFGVESDGVIVKKKCSNSR